MSLAATLTFSRFIDLLLALLYDLEQEHGTEKFFDLSSMAAALKEKVPPRWVFDAGKVLESRGLATCIFALGGRVDAELTGEGRMLVEQKREQGAGIVAEYLERPADYVVVGSPGAAAARTIREERQPAFDLLDRMEQEIDADSTLGPQEKQDLRTDVDTLRKQLGKREPNRVVLASLLEPLSRVASIASSVANLITLINV